MQLPTTTFGADGPLTTRIGLGGAVITHESEEMGVRTIHAALEAGVKYFDTSPGYCNRRSQPVFGEGLARAPDDVMVATKVGYFDDPADYRRPEAIRAQITESLELLRRERVDLLQAHEANWRAWWSGDNGTARGREQIRDDEPYRFADAPVITELTRAREAGLCRFTGITGNVADQMTRVLKDVEVDALLIAFNYDLVQRRATKDALPLARSRNLPAILGAIFRGSRIIEPHPEWIDNPPDWMTPTLRSAYARLYELQAQSGFSLVELAVRFSLARTDVAVVLIGAKNPDELHESLRAAEKGGLPADLHAAIEAIGTDEA